MGTVQYMSPEQARGLETDARTDIWSLGVVLYELLAGRSTFEGKTSSDVIAAILRTEPPPLTVYVRDAPPELERIVTKALQKDREERYQDVKDLAPRPEKPEAPPRRRHGVGAPASGEQVDSATSRRAHPQPPHS